MDSRSYEGMKITVMGLGLNGGGLACVRYFASKGAAVTATDLRDETILRPSLDQLKDLSVRYVLGEHRMEDFEQADLVIKNPAVPADSPYLRAARRVETDLSVFLTDCRNPLIAVTGSKGKSTVVSALYAVLSAARPGTRLGGNITVSPLTFLDDLKPEDPVILELSSWQLGDLKGRNLLHPDISVITNIMNDHQNRYDSFEDYVDDKKEVYRGQNPGQKAIFLNDDRGRQFAAECPAASLFYDFSREAGVSIWQEGDRGFLDGGTGPEELLPRHLKVPGRYFRQNCLIAAAAARLFGVESADIRRGLENFQGVPHRMELVGTAGGVSYYNDTTATIPEALKAGVESFECPVRLLAGGNDKELDYECARNALDTAAGVYLLKGTATEKIISVMQREGIPFHGPFASLEEAFRAASEDAAPGDAVLLSPGATSFGMFVNEFERGDLFRKLAGGLPAS